MRYKVGDKVRISKCSAKILKGQIDVIEEVYPHDNSYKLSRFDIRIAESNLRPAEFKIWCETEEKKQAVLEELEKEGYRWSDPNKKPTEYINDIISDACPIGFCLREDRLLYNVLKDCFDTQLIEELTPSEFTGIDFSEKIIITKTSTGATATYGDKIVTTEGEFDDASRQALAEVLCPFKVGDKVKNKYKGIGEVTNIKISSDYHCVISVYHADSGHNVKYYINELEPYTEPSYNAKLFCIEGHGVFKQGVVYTVENGIFTGVYVSHFKDLDDINKNLIAQFMEIKGGLDD